MSWAQNLTPTHENKGSCNLAWSGCSVPKGHKDREGQREAEYAWEAESGSRGETKSFIRKYIKIPAP